MKKQSGFAHIFILLILFIGMGAGIYLVGQKTNFFPKAAISIPISWPLSPTPTKNPISGPITCKPRPACLDLPRPCMMPEPVDGWCPTPTPTIVCKTGLNTFSVNTSCSGSDRVTSGSFRYAFYRCYDGKSGSLGGPTSCKPSGVWKAEAEAACAGRSSCTPSPTTIIKPTATPVPVVQTIDYIETWPGSLYIPSLPNSENKMAIQALLKDRKTGAVVSSQSGLVYSWKVEDLGGSGISVSPFSECSKGVLPPCPQDHAIVTVPVGQRMSSGNIWVSVSKDNVLLARAEFVANIVPQSQYTSFSNVYPNGGESFSVGQKVIVRWQMSGNPVDYYNLYYSYYKNGTSTSGYIGSKTYGNNSIEWTIPQELQGQKVMVYIEPRRNGAVVGMGISSNFFNVVGPMPLVKPRVTTAPGKPSVSFPSFIRNSWQSLFR